MNLNSLHLTREEAGEVKIARGEREDKERDLNMLLITRVLVNRNISLKIIERTRKKAWRLKGNAELVTCDTVGNNLFIVNFSDKVDKEWVLKNGPWSFDDKIMVLSELKEGEQVMDRNLERTVMSFHLLNLPMDWKTEAAGRKLGAAWEKYWKCREEPAQSEYGGSECHAASDEGGEGNG